MTTEIWRPEKNVWQRSVVGVKNVLSSPKTSPWTVEGWSFDLCAGLFAQIDLGERTKEQRQGLAQFFYEAMYFNRYIDLFVCRAKRGLPSLDFLEKFWCLDERKEKLKQQLLGAGFSKQSVVTVDSWFELNKTLNFLSLELCKNNGSLDNKSVLNDGARPDNGHLIQIEKLMENEDFDGIDRAIYFRALTAAGFAKTLGSLAFNQPVNIDFGFNEWRRLSSLVMITQILDDFSTPVKDVKHSIWGTTRSLFTKTQLQGETLKIDGDQARQAVNLARDMLAGCLDIAQFEPKKTKETIIYWGTLVLSGFAFLAMGHKYGGSDYPISTTLGTALKKIIEASQRKNHYSKYKETTKSALENSLQLLS